MEMAAIVTTVVVTEASTTVEVDLVSHSLVSLTTLGQRATRTVMASSPSGRQRTVFSRAPAAVERNRAATTTGAITGVTTGAATRTSMRASGGAMAVGITIYGAKIHGAIHG